MLGSVWGAKDTGVAKSLASLSLHSRGRRQIINRETNKIILENDKRKAEPRLKPCSVGTRTQLGSYKLRRKLRQNGSLGGSPGYSLGSLEARGVKGRVWSQGASLGPAVRGQGAEGRQLFSGAGPALHCLSLWGCQVGTPSSRYSLTTKIEAFSPWPGHPLYSFIPKWHFHFQHPTYKGSLQTPLEFST